DVKHRTIAWKSCGFHRHRIGRVQSERGCIYQEPGIAKIFIETDIETGKLSAQLHDQRLDRSGCLIEDAQALQACGRERMADRASSAAGADHGGAALGIEHPGLARGIDEAA